MKKPLTTYLEEDIYNRIQEIAKKNKRSVSNQAEVILENEVNEKTDILAGKTQLSPDLVAGR